LWTHFEFTRMNITATILRKSFEDLRGRESRSMSIAS